MTFEYRDRDGDAFTARPTIGTPKPAILLHISPSNSAHVPLDHVEEVVAGIRDAARQAAGQTTTTEPDARKAAIVTLAMPCDTCAHTLNWHRNDVGCTLDRCACGRFREPEQPAVEQPAEAQPADLLAECATEYHVPVPEGGGTNLLVRRQALVHGTGWSVCTRAYGGGRAWTTEGWQESISALSVDRLFCWPDPATAVDEARRALATTP